MTDTEQEHPSATPTETAPRPKWACPRPGKKKVPLEEAPVPAGEPLPICPYRNISSVFEEIARREDPNGERGHYARFKKALASLPPAERQAAMMKDRRYVEAFEKYTAAQEETHAALASWQKNSPELHAFRVALIRQRTEQSRQEKKRAAADESRIRRRTNRRYPEDDEEDEEEEDSELEERRRKKAKKMRRAMEEEEEEEDSEREERRRKISKKKRRVEEEEEDSEREERRRKIAKKKRRVVEEEEGDSDREERRRKIAKKKRRAAEEDGDDERRDRRPKQGGELATFKSRMLPKNPGPAEILEEIRLTGAYMGRLTEQASRIFQPNEDVRAAHRVSAGPPPSIEEEEEEEEEEEAVEKRGGATIVEEEEEEEEEAMSK